MVIRFIKPPVLCPTCGEFIPRNPLRPNAYELHDCPDRRVVPPFPQRAGDTRYERLLILVHRLKVATRNGEELGEEEQEEFSKLMKLHKGRFPKQGLKNWFERQDNAKAITRLAEAAERIRVCYSAYMPPTFLAALLAEFIQRSVEDETPCTCFVWHKTPGYLMKRLERVSNKRPAGNIDAMTIRWDNAESCSGPALLSGTYPPLNRSIEFEKPKLDTLTHEMIHWCASPEFNLEAQKYSGNDYALICEGATEWLKRHATGDWANGGYTDVMPRFIALMRTDKIRQEELMAAYFGGVNAVQVVAKIKDTDDELQRQKVDAVMQASNAAEFKRFQEQFTDSRFAVAKRSNEYREKAYSIFGALADAALDQALRGARADWKAYLRARKSGDDDAEALRKSSRL